MTKAIETAKALIFGTELEYTSISRERAARAIHTVVGGTIRHTGGGYDEWTVIAPDGRNWKAVSDGSLTDRATSAEVVTPILKWDDIETLQAVVRALRHAGAKTPDCTSQHVHVGIADFDARQIANIARIFYKQEELILKAAGTLERRLQHYTRRTDRAFIERLEKAKPTTRDALNRAWFGYANPTPSHYDGPATATSTTTMCGGRARSNSGFSTARPTPERSRPTFSFASRLRRKPRPRPAPPPKTSAPTTRQAPSTTCAFSFCALG